MAILKPFQTLRPAPRLAAQICSPPYDTLNAREAVEIAQNNLHTFLHITRSEIAFEEMPKPFPDKVYARASENLGKFIKENTLIRDTQPGFMVYRLRTEDHTQTGIIGLSPCKEFRTGIIKNHELTRLDKIEERARHIRASRAHTGPVFLFYKSRDDLNALLESFTQGKPCFSFDAEDGVNHTAWLIQDPEEIRQIQTAFSEIQSLYIADGHHLTAAAAAFCKESMKSNPNHTGEEPYNYFLTASFPHDQVRVLSYNRVLRDLNGSTPAQVLQMIRELATVETLPQAAPPDRKGVITFYLDKKWYKMKWKPSISQSSDPVAGLDVAILQNRLLSPVLFIENPRTDTRIRFAGVNRGIKELEKMVDSGENAIAFVLYPTSVTDLMAAADKGSLMPPKSTWFQPKLRDGIAVHLID